jgi:spermidine synthase
VRVGDARVLLRRERADSADAVVGDAFGGRSIPWHLATAEFARDVRRVLRPDGVYLLNVIDRGDLSLARAEAATLLEVFANVTLVARDGPAPGNLVLLASDAPLPRFAPAEARLYDAERFARGADVLTDDHAPADQLLTP